MLLKGETALTHKFSYQTSYIRQKATKQEIGVSQHALDNMGERAIWLDEALEALEALEAIISGDEIEIQTFEGKNVRVLFQESTTHIPRFCVVVAIDHPAVQIVTVFDFKEEKFEYIEKKKCWRRKNELH
jgi:hypothetical protein